MYFDHVYPPTLQLPLDPPQTRALLISYPLLLLKRQTNSPLSPIMYMGAEGAIHWNMSTY